jgi:hypothetical protein
MAAVLQPRQAPRAIVAPSPSKTPSARDGVPTALPASVGLFGAPTQKEETKAATPSKPKTTTQEKAAAAAAQREDKTTLEAKARAAKALEARPGFASREDAVAWLRDTLDGDPAAKNLTGAFEQEVNAELVSDTDKLLDHSASMKREIARSEFHLLPEEWPGWKPAKHELPGLLVAVALLSLGAPYWYNVLKNLASLRPLLAIKPEYRKWDRRA